MKIHYLIALFISTSVYAQNYTFLGQGTDHQGFNGPCKLMIKEETGNIVEILAHVNGHIAFSARNTSTSNHNIKLKEQSKNKIVAVTGGFFLESGILPSSDKMKITISLDENGHPTGFTSGGLFSIDKMTCAFTN